MASMRSIKRRKASVESTQQITKAMKLVSTVKLQKARAKVETNKPYFDALYSTISSILARTADNGSSYISSNDSSVKAVIEVSSNRGLAGGYNSNLVKAVDKMDFPKDSTIVYAYGRKGMEGLMKKGYNIVQDYSEVINEPLYDDCVVLTKEIIEKFDNGEIGEVYIAYTDFVNTVTHIPVVKKLFPISREDFDSENIDTLMNYGEDGVGDEADSEIEVLEYIIPKYMTNMIFGAFMEAIASENAARMQAMDSATSNADDMISSLSLQYNRARQNSITQELTEIIAGAEAIT